MKAGGTFGCLVHFAGTPLRVGQKKFAGPVSLSSTVSTDFRLPATAFGLGFDLLALCARRKRESNGLDKRVKGPKKNVAAICEVFLFQHFHSVSSNLWRRLWKGTSGGRKTNGVTPQLRRPTARRH